MSLFSTEVRDQPAATAAHVLGATNTSERYRAIGKRALDLFLVISTMWFTVPLIAILALAVAVTGQNPFYIQDRVGLNGETFKIWKLRTMLPNAKERLEVYLAENPDARAEWDAKQKLANDPRITGFGNFLRKSSLDELPQLINVLFGSMSLVGPRPMMPEQKQQYVRTGGTAYFRLRPGMSGLWQVSDRNDCEFISRVRFDEKYDKDLSFGTDVRVLAQTVGVVLRGTGV